MLGIRNRCRAPAEACAGTVDRSDSNRLPLDEWRREKAEHMAITPTSEIH
jgi:hypothetical protein